MFKKKKSFAQIYKKIKNLINNIDVTFPQQHWRRADKVNRRTE